LGLKEDRGGWRVYVEKIFVDGHFVESVICCGHKNGVACTLLRWVGVRIYILHKMRGAGIGIGLRYW
jgi:hypothetical protein